MNDDGDNASYVHNPYLYKGQAERCGEHPLPVQHEERPSRELSEYRGHPLRPVELKGNWYSTNRMKLSDTRAYSLCGARMLCFAHEGRCWLRCRGPECSP